MENAIHLVCPQCRVPLKKENDDLCCSTCGKQYASPYGIPDFVGYDIAWSYGGNEQQMRLVALAQTQGWQEAVSTVFPHPHEAEWLTDLTRGKACLLTNITRESLVLDVGCGWGVVSLFSSEMCREVHAIDITMAALQFLSLRARQEGRANVRPARVDLMAANPFPPESFDVIILNGVLEWVPEYRSGNPREVQRQFLQRCRNLLRMGGQILIGIENRTGFPYFLGYPDEHTGLRWVTLLPRAMANRWSHIRRRKPYRTHTYSPNGLRRLLRSAGYGDMRMYYPLKSYRKPSLILNHGDVDGLWKAVTNEMCRRAPHVLARLLKACGTPWVRQASSLAFDRLFAPSLYLVATRCQ